MLWVNINLKYIDMKTLKLNEMEIINGEGACAAVTVADAVVVGGGAAAYWGWIAFTPIGATVIVVAGIGLAGASLYCAFSD